ncbi:MAG TPA: hypothetical protein PKE69_18710 [Pyrinomonadaceae bacterium]|nr:hypothetical protein [Pyrinomonadaceae bacterium]
MKFSILIILLLIFCFSTTSAQDKITEIRITVLPATMKIRPMETAVIQVQFFGEKAKKDVLDKVFASENDGKLQISDWKVSTSGGWLSKPFFLQDANEKVKSGIDNFIAQGLNSVAAKDSILFTAPNKIGKYTIKITRGEISKEVTIEVSNSAASQKKAETANFSSAVNSTDKYFALVENYAPFVAQETWFEPKADYLARFDYDGNWKGDDNWENLQTGSSKAFVYYAVMETETHWFLIYNFFHPRDYSDFCVAASCHENDNEGLILTVRKDSSKFGKLEVMETLAHNNIYSFTNNSAIKKGVHDIDGKIEFYENTHPIIFIEAGGHGVFSSNYKSSLFDATKMEFKQNTGVTYVYGKKAESPQFSNDRNISYALLPIYDEWWMKGNQETAQANDTFDNFYIYEPFGNRPRANTKYISGAFHGTTAAKNQAKPFWAWFDKKTKDKKILNTGQWALDPAYAVSMNLKFPNDLPVSLEYIFNPYLKQ